MIFFSRQDMAYQSGKRIFLGRTAFCVSFNYLFAFFGKRFLLYDFKCVTFGNFSNGFFIVILILVKE